MAFRFTLDVLLRVRESIERQQEARLQEANQCLALLLQRSQNLEARMTDLTASRLHELALGLSAAELQFNLLCRGVLAQEQSVLQREIARAEANRNQCRQAFQQARQQREVVDTLRHHQLLAYRREQARLEQRRLDDLFLLRRAHKRS